MLHKAVRCSLCGRFSGVVNRYGMCGACARGLRGRVHKSEFDATFPTRVLQILTENGYAPSSGGDVGSFTTSSGTVSCPAGSYTDLLEGTVVASVTYPFAALLVAWQVSWLNGATPPTALQVKLNSSQGGQPTWFLPPGLANVSYVTGGMAITKVGSVLSGNSVLVTPQLQPTTQGVTGELLYCTTQLSLIPSNS